MSLRGIKEKAAKGITGLRGLGRSRREKRQEKRSWSPAKNRDKKGVVRELANDVQGSSAMQSLLLSGDGHGDESSGGGESIGLLNKKPSVRTTGQRKSYGSQLSDREVSLGLGINEFQPTVRHTLETDDSWTRLSLKYSVPIVELQRINKMYPTDEVFAKTELLIPINDANKDVTSGLPEGPKAGSVPPGPTSTPSTSDSTGSPQQTEPVLGAPFYANSEEPSAKAKSFFAKFDADFNRNKEKLGAMARQ